MHFQVIESQVTSSPCTDFFELTNQVCTIPIPISSKLANFQVFSGHQGPVTSGNFTHDGKAIVSTGGEDDCTLRVWNPKTGDCTLTLSNHPFHTAGK